MDDQIAFDRYDIEELKRKQRRMLHIATATTYDCATSSPSVSELIDHGP